MSEMQNQNKEDRENKFLSDRIIQKAITQGEIDNASVNNINELFETVLAQHRGDAVRTRAELLMSTLRDHLKNQKQPKSDDGLHGKDRDLLEKIINEKIITAGLSEELLELARETIFDETKHIIGTEVDVGIIKRLVDKELEAFKQTHGLNKVQKDDQGEDTGKNADLGSQKETDRKKVLEKTETTKGPTEDNVKSEEKENDAGVQIKQSMSQSSQEKESDGDTEESVKKKQSLTEIMLEKARKDDKNNPLKPNTLHWPTSTISFDTPDKTAQSPDSNKKALSAGISTRNVNKTPSPVKSQSAQQSPKVSVQPKADIPKPDVKPKKAEMV